MRFVKNVANLTYDNLEAFEEFKRDSRLAHIDMASSALKVKHGVCLSNNVK